MYVDTRNGDNIVMGSVPNYYTFPDGSRTGDFHLLNESVHIREGFLPFSDNIPSFDARYQYAMPGDIVIAEDRKSATRDWTITDRDLDVMKSAKKVLVNDFWKQKERSGFYYNDKVFDSDIVSVIRLTTSLNATTPPEKWKTKDNQLVDITAEYLQGMVDALKDNANLLFMQANNHKTAIDGLPTALEVADYDITVNW